MLKNILLSATLTVLAANAAAALNSGDKAALAAMCPWFGDFSSGNHPKWQAFCANPSATELGVTEGGVGKRGYRSV